MISRASRSIRSFAQSCHGKAGQGTDKEYLEPLLGEKSVNELALLIEKTMPKDRAGECVGEDARKVAAYIHEAFYSPAAQERNRPARIELSRLTVRQYRQAAADLIGSFQEPQPAWGQERGLRGDYSKNRRFRSNDRLLERLDPTVSFDFGEGSPDAEKIDAAEFAIRWQGGLIAPETGEYEFLIKTENGARLWINNEQRPLIDAWVRSGSDTEHRQSIWLLGGRVYPLRLEMFKSKEKRASIALWWKLPQQAEQLIPQRYLLPVRASESLVVQTPFPPDDRSIGYERGTSISKAWEQATTDAAIEAAGYVMAHLDELAELGSIPEERQARLREFCRQFAERAFRRPLSEEQQRLYIDRQFEGSPDLQGPLNAACC